MLLLREVDLSTICNLKVQRTFLLDGCIYAMGKSYVHMNLTSLYTYSIDTDTFSVKLMPVICHGFSDGDCYDNEVVVHRGVAYTWNTMDAEMLSGRLENGAFHWRIVPTTGPKPRKSAICAVGIVEKDYAKYVAMIDDSYSVPEEEAEDGANDNFIYKCELDLETMVWNRVETERDDKDNGTSEDSLGYVCDYRLLKSRDGYHAFRTFLSSHYVLESAGIKWTRDQSGWTSDCTAFTALDNLYKIEWIKSDDGHDLIVYRYEAECNEWEQLRKWSTRCRSFDTADKCNVIAIGSRVYVFVINICFLKHIIILELDPTLFDLSLHTILRNESLREWSMCQLPASISRLLVRDTSGDALVLEDEEIIEYC